MSRGRVILVGAGPGSPDLITVRGARALAEADAVVYDALASPELLDLAPARAERFNVGKRGHDAPTVPQQETTALLLRLAAEGKTVVRLKGGDPYVFGRGGEEASACAEAGVDFEVVPGVSSIFGALAHAGIPITDRRHAASFAVVTGHKDPTKVSEETRWELLAHAADTLLVLMGMRNLGDIVGRLLGAGRAPSTPSAVVMNGTLPTQRVVEAPLGELVERVREAGLSAPSVVVVGDVVGLRSALAWYERQPLFGKRVLVTRSEDQAGDLSMALVSAGALPVVVPMIEMQPARDPAPLDAALARLADYDALVFTSANAVRFTHARAVERGVDPAAFEGRVLCVGPATADAALAAGFPVHHLPANRFDAEGVLALVREAFPARGRRFLLPGSASARSVLPDGLRADGGEVDAVVAYHTLPAAVDAGALRARLLAGELDVLTFTSPSTARHFLGHLDDASREAAGRCVVAAIGPVTADALRAAGLPPDVVSPSAGVPALVAALEAHVAGEREAG
ncbi:MAG: uroporphyrinogen-III C-methyltransferase [Myxococcota bacterium]